METISVSVAFFVGFANLEQGMIDDHECYVEDDSAELLKRYFKYTSWISSVKVGESSYKFFTAGICSCDPDKDHPYISRLTYEVAEVIDAYFGDMDFVVNRDDMTISVSDLEKLVNELSKLLNIPLYHGSM